MGLLNDFLKHNAPLPGNASIAVSQRFTDGDGNPKLWEIKALTYAEDEAIRRECTKSAAANCLSELDKLDYSVKLAARCVVFPNLNDAELQDSYGVMGAEDLLREMLSPGEFILLTNAVYEHNSMLPTFADELDEARDLLKSGDYEAETAFYCLQKFNILPSQIMSLPRRERAFITAVIERDLALKNAQ